MGWWGGFHASSELRQSRLVDDGAGGAPVSQSLT